MNRQDVENWLNSYNIKNYTINDDLIVNVSGSVNLDNKDLAQIPIQFGEVLIDFNCGNNRLTSLRGSPYKVFRDFSCSENKLTSFEFGPQYVGRNLFAIDNLFTNLLHSPQYVGATFYCGANELESLDGLKEFSIFTSTSSILIKDEFLAPLFKKNRMELTMSDWDKIVRFKKLNTELGETDATIKRKKI